MDSFYRKQKKLSMGVVRHNLLVKVGWLLCCESILNT